MTFNGLGEIISADMCADKFPLMLIGGWVGGLTYADLWARPPSAWTKIFNQYDQLLDSDVTLSHIPAGSVQTVDTIYKALLKKKTKTSTVANDIPAKVIKMYVQELALHLTQL